jgi:hypothetical protein
MERDAVIADKEFCPSDDSGVFADRCPPAEVDSTALGRHLSTDRTLLWTTDNHNRDTTLMIRQRGPSIFHSAPPFREPNASRRENDVTTRRGKHPLKIRVKFSSWLWKKS